MLKKLNCCEHVNSQENQMIITSDQQVVLLLKSPLSKQSQKQRGKFRYPTIGMPDKIDIDESSLLWVFRYPTIGMPDKIAKSKTKKPR